MKKISMLSIVLGGLQILSAQTGTSSQTEKTITVDGIGHHKTYSMNGGNATIAGVDNVITFKGTVAKLEVSGSGNTVFTDKINRVTVDGTGNKVFYKSAPSKTGKPATSMNGVGNSIQKK